MPEGPLGGPRPLVDEEGEGPAGFLRPFATTVDECVNSVEAQRFVDNFEEAMGEPIPTVEQKEAMKRAWCHGIIEDDTILDKWVRGLERSGVEGLGDRIKESNKRFREGFRKGLPFGVEPDE